MWGRGRAEANRGLANRRLSGDLARLYRPCGFRLFDGDPLWLPVVMQKGTGAPGMPRGRWQRKSLVWLGGILLRLGKYTSVPYAWGANRVSLPFLLAPALLNLAIFIPALSHRWKEGGSWVFVFFVVAWIVLIASSMPFGLYRRRKYLREHPSTV